VRFRDRLATPTVDNVTVFADDGTGIPFMSAVLDYGTEQLANQIIVDAPAGTAVANGVLSQTRYGILERSIPTLLSDVDQLVDAAAYFVGLYEEPELRFDLIRVALDSLSPSQRAEVLGLEIGDVCEVRFTPGNPPTGAPVERYGLLINIAHDIAPDSHYVTLGFGSLQTSLFVIGDPEFGTIGEGAPGVLGF
jgi:hypothetical protein